MSAEGDDRCRNGGGSGPEEERAELLETFGKMYTEDKKKLLDTIIELMGEGHTAGGKAVLLERVVTASLMSKKPADEEEASMELLSDERTMAASEISKRSASIRRATSETSSSRRSRSCARTCSS